MNTAGTDAGPENAVAAVVLAADALAGLHVHGVGNSDGSGCQAAGEGGKTGSKGPLAHGCSLRDNCIERRIFPPNPLEIAVAAPVFNLPTTV